jgi:translation initiation factor IF-3
MGKTFQKKENFNIRVNDDIRYYEARVIYKEHNDSVSDNDFNKIMRVADARRFAEAKGLDLIEINGKSTPPIIKVYDYTKYLWELKQAEKKKKKNIVDTKEIQLSVNISTHDIEIKAKRAKEFIEKGDNVRVVLTMRGRELTRREESSRSFYEFLGMMGDNISYISAPRDEGNKVITTFKKKK